MPDRLDEFLLALSVIEQRVAATEEPMTLIVPENFKQFALVLSSLPMVFDRRSTARDRRHTIRRIREERFTHLYVLRAQSMWVCLRSGVPYARRRGLPLVCRRRLAAKRRGHSTVDTVYILQCISKTLEWQYTTPCEWNGVSVAHCREHENAIVIGLDEDLSGKNLNDTVAYIHKHHKRQFVLVGPRDCAAFAESITEKSPGNVQNLCGNTNLNRTLHIIASAGVLISGNLDYLHLAGYLGTPHVALQGKDIILRNVPFGFNETVLDTHDRNKPCEPKIAVVAKASSDSINRYIMSYAKKHRHRKHELGDDTEFTDQSRS